MEWLQQQVVPLITFVVGLLAGNYHALWRDRRKEFNTAAAPIREWIIRQVEARGPYPRPTAVQMDAFEQCLSRRELERFRRACIDFDHADACERQQDSSGQVRYINVERVERATRALMPFTDRR
jgi:hypothetical protein